MVAERRPDVPAADLLVAKLADEAAGDAIATPRFRSSLEGHDLHPG
jgi:hypothetical protein